MKKSPSQLQYAAARHKAEGWDGCAEARSSLTLSALHLSSTLATLAVPPHLVVSTCSRSLKRSEEPGCSPAWRHCMETLHDPACVQALQGAPRGRLPARQAALATRWPRAATGEALFKGVLGLRRAAMAHAVKQPALAFDHRLPWQHSVHVMATHKPCMHAAVQVPGPGAADDSTRALRSRPQPRTGA